jgi:hypothetical protein
MRHARVRLGALCLGCAALAVQLDGCAGTVPGRRLEDPLEREAGVAEHYRIERLTPGTRVTLELRDTTFVSGRFERLTTVDPETYAQRYATWRLPDSSAALPPLGSPVTLVSGSSKRSTARFEGFGFERLLVRYGESGKTKSFGFQDLAYFEDSSGHRWSGGTLTRLLMSGALPLVTAMSISSGDTITDVPLDRVERVAFRPSNDRVIAGVVVAVTLVAVVIIAYSQSRRPHTVACNERDPVFWLNARDPGVVREALSRRR